MVLQSGPFLADRDINAEWSTLFPDEPASSARAEGASVDLALGTAYHLSSRKTPDRLSREKPYLVIPRGDFALLMTEERIHIPDDMAALITMKLRIKAQGLLNVSGFHVDPGFEGPLVYAVYNVGPQEIIIKLGEPVFTIFFAMLSGSAEHPYRKDDMLNLDGLPDWMIANLTSSDPVNVVTLDDRVGRVEARLNLVLTAAALVIAPIAVFIVGERLIR